MEKSELLKSIAETGYNVGFGAKKHFATYDIVVKTPGFISFFSMAFGIYALAFDGLSTKFLSASFIILGIIGLYITLYDGQKSSYEASGAKLTQIYNKLGLLYRRAKTAESSTFKEIETELLALQGEYYASNQTKQIMFSDWYAHYKFFWQHQIEWVNEQKKFKLFRDKIPLSLTLTVIGLALASAVFCSSLLSRMCSYVIG